MRPDERAEVVIFHVSLPVEKGFLIEAEGWLWNPREPKGVIPELPLKNVTVPFVIVPSAIVVVLGLFVEAYPQTDKFTTLRVSMMSRGHIGVMRRENAHEQQRNLRRDPDSTCESFVPL